MATKQKVVLLVDDRNESRLTTKWFLSVFGYVIDASYTAEEAISKFDPARHAAVITDNTMEGGMTGGEMAKVLKLRSPSTPILMYSGHPPEDQTSLDFVLQKPAHLLVLKEALDRLVKSPPAQASTNAAPGI